jgi:hypothetical protein
MSSLRIFGCCIALLGLVGAFLFYRGEKWNRLNFLLLLTFNLALLVVSLSPDTLNTLRDMLALKTTQRGRIISLLVVANLFLGFYLFYTNTKLARVMGQFDLLVRHLGNVAADVTDLAIRPVMVLIPAFNEADNLKELLPRIPATVEGLPVGVLIVDDGSSDGTCRAGDAFEHIHVVRNPINRGGGAALRLGYDILQSMGARICVTMDADGQHRPEEISHLVAPCSKRGRTASSVRA